MSIPQEINFTFPVISKINIDIKGKIKSNILIENISEYLKTHKHIVARWFDNKQGYELDEIGKVKEYVLDGDEKAKDEGSNDFNREYDFIREEYKKDENGEEIEDKLSEQEYSEAQDTDLISKQREFIDAKDFYLISFLSKLNQKQMIEASEKFTGNTYKTRAKARKSLGEYVGEYSTLDKDRLLEVLSEYGYDDLISYVEYIVKYKQYIANKRKEYFILDIDKYLDLSFDSFDDFYSQRNSFNEDGDVLYYRALLAFLFSQSKPKEWPWSEVNEKYGCYQKPTLSERFSIGEDQEISENDFGGSEIVKWNKDFSSLDTIGEMLEWASALVRSSGKSKIMYEVVSSYVGRYWFLASGFEIEPNRTRVVINFLEDVSPSEKEEENERQKKELKNKRK